MIIVRSISLAGILIFYLAIPNARPDFTRFNAHDSEIYLSLSHSLAHGRGYTRSMIEGDYVPHKTWPPGVPALLIPAMAVGGERVNWRAVKWTMAAVGVLGIALTWLVARRLSGNLFAADLAALAVALNPYYWHFSHQAMAEIPLTIWIIGSLLMIDKVWAGRRVSYGEAGVVGFVTGLGALIKGHALGIAIVPLAYLLGSRRSPMNFFHHCKVWLVFSFCFIIPMAVWTARNLTVHADGIDGVTQLYSVFAQEPMNKESTVRTPMKAAGVILENLRYYFIYQVPRQILPGLWAEGVFDWRGSGLVALGLSTVLVFLTLWPPAPVLPILAVIAPITALNLVVDHGGAPRYWVPVTTAATIILAIRGAALLSRQLPARRVVAAAAIAAVLAGNLAVYIVWHERNPYRPDGAYPAFAKLTESAAKASLRPAAVLVTGNPQAFQLITGYPVPVRLKSASYSHMVTRVDGWGDAVPAGAKKLIEEHPWALFELPRIMHHDEIFNGSK